MLDRLAWLIATVCGIGHTPAAAGTAASAVTAAVWFITAPSLAWQWIICAALIIKGLWASDRYARRTGIKDPQRVVIDEVAGMWMALLGAPHELSAVAVGFAAFRIFDIFKMPPIKRLERLPGGWGIMMDDVAAGLLARATVWLADRFLLR